MKPVNNKILVRVNMRQKDSMTVGGITVKLATQFDTNYRERSPVVCEVVKGNGFVIAGDILLCHHNTFYTPSPFYLHDDLFSIPFTKIVFAKVGVDGNLAPLCGNIICERMIIETFLPLPPEQQKPYIDRALVKDGSGTPYKAGQLIFHRPHASYEIVYIWQGIEKRVVKVPEEQVCGVLI